MDFESNFKFNFGSIEHNQNHLAYVQSFYPKLFFF